MIIRAAVEIQSKTNRTLKNLAGCGVFHHFYNSACSCCLHILGYKRMSVTTNLYQ